MRTIWGSHHTDEDGAEAKFLGVSKPPPSQSTSGVPAAAAAASTAQAAPARNAVLDEWVRVWTLRLLRLARQGQAPVQYIVTLMDRSIRARSLSLQWGDAAGR